MSDNVTVDLAGLFGRLNAQAMRCVEEAGGWAFGRGNYEVTPAHLFSKLVEDRGSDVPPILSHYEVDTGRLLRALEDSLERLREGSGGELSYSPALIDWVTDAWLLSSVDFDQTRIRSGALLLAALLTPGKYLSHEVHEFLSKISVEKLREQLSKSNVESAEEKEMASGSDTAGGIGHRRGEVGRVPGEVHQRLHEGRPRRGDRSRLRQGSGDSPDAGHPRSPSEEQPDCGRRGGRRKVRCS